MINVYSDEHQTALKCPKNIKANLHNILVMARDFNISNYNWDPSYLFHSSHNNSLFEIADSFDLKSSILIQQVPNQYVNNSNNTNSVINLLFLCLNAIKMNNHHILPEL